jgi:hypothetical protein
VVISRSTREIKERENFHVLKSQLKGKVFFCWVTTSAVGLSRVLGVVLKVDDEVEKNSSIERNFFYHQLRINISSIKMQKIFNDDKKSSIKEEKFMEEKKSLNIDKISSINHKEIIFSIINLSKRTKKNHHYPIEMP